MRWLFFNRALHAGWAYYNTQVHSQRRTHSGLIIAIETNLWKIDEIAFDWKLVTLVGRLSILTGCLSCVLLLSHT